MRLPSLQRLAGQAAAVARRFPLALACGVISAVAAGLMIDAGAQEEFYRRILFASSLGLPLFTGLELLGRRHGWGGVGKLLAALCGVAFLVGVYLLRHGWSDPVATSRYFQLSLGLHLFVAVGPYLGVEEQNGFWQYNMTLFLRFLVAGVFAAVLYLGLSVALLAVDNLFELEVNDRWYGRLWFTLAFVFHPWVFLGGVPDDLPALDARRAYPPVLKVFAQYVLAPIVALYLLILTAYLGKVLLTQQWPSGWIGWLVSSVAAAGILSLLLLHPIEEREENRWVSTYARWFWVALIPSIGMLLAAIWKRIDQYGITERRYFLVVLSVWLAGIALFYILRRRGSIKVIPATLGVLAFLTIAGPWGAYAVSERSQVARLEEILDRNGMLAEGRLRRPAGDVSYEDRREISAVVRYLAETHDLAAAEPWFASGLPVVESQTGEERSSRESADASARAVVEAMGIGYVDRWAGVTDSRFSFSARGVDASFPLEGHEHLVRVSEAGPDSITLGGRTLQIAWDAEVTTLTLSDSSGSLASASLRPAVEAALAFRADSSGSRRIPARVMRTESSAGEARMTVYLSSVAGERSAGPDGAESLDIDSFQADVLVTLPVPQMEADEGVE